MQNLGAVFYQSLVLGVVLTGLLCQAHAGEPYGRTGLFVIEREGDPDNPTAVKARTYAPEVAPGEGKSLRLYADVSVPATILIAAFDRYSGQLLLDFPPVLADHKEGFEEALYPLSNAELSFDQKKTIELYVIVLQPEDAALQKLRKLVMAIAATTKNSDASPEILKHQSNDLKKMVDDWVRRNNAAEFAIRYPEPATAGLQRGSSILWREHAHKFPVTGKAPTVRLFRIGPVQQEKK